MTAATTRASLWRDPLTVSLARFKANAELIGRLESLQLPSYCNTVKKTTMKLRACSDLTNTYVAAGFDNKETGELYGSAGTFAACGSRICAFCAHRHSRQSFLKVRSQIVNVHLSDEQRWQFITLTLPVVQKVGLLESIEAIRDGFALFRKRDYFREVVAGGYRCVEWTWRNNRSPNVHIHMLVYGKRIDQRIFANEWTASIEKSWKRRGRSLVFNTRNNGANLDIKVLPKAGSHLEEQLLQRARYICKPHNWEGATDADLIRLAGLKRLPRLLASVGAIHGRSHSSLDSAHLKDGVVIKSSVSRRDPKVYNSVTLDQEWLLRFARRQAKQRVILPMLYPHARITTLADLQANTANSSDWKFNSEQSTGSQRSKGSTSSSPAERVQLLRCFTFRKGGHASPPFPPLPCLPRWFLQAMYVVPRSSTTALTRSPNRARAPTSFESTSENIAPISFRQIPSTGDLWQNNLLRPLLFTRHATGQKPTS